MIPQQAKKITTTFIVLAMAALSSLAAAPSTSSPAQAAIERAHQEQKYLFLFCYDANSSETQAGERVFTDAMAEVGDRAHSARVSMQAPEERRFIADYGLRRAPLPFVLVLAPNGAVMRGFPQKFTKDDLLDSFGTPAMESSIKALQDDKLVIVSIQGQRTKDNAAVTEAIETFRSDARFAKNATLVLVDCDDARETPFLEQLEAKRDSTEVTTILIAPPSQVIARFEGRIDAQQLVASVKDAVSGGCADGQCCPGGKCGK